MSWSRAAASGASTAAVGVMLYLLVVVILGQDYNTKSLTLIPVFGIGVLGLTLIFGVAHQLQLGHALFFAAGAYGYSVLAGADLAWSPMVAAGIAVVGVAVLAWLVGLVLLRLEGFYFAVGTLGLGLIGANVLFALRSITGGDNGLPAPGFSVFGYAFDTPLRKYVLVWGVLAVGIVLALNLKHSRAGRAARAVGLDEPMAAAQGVRVSQLKNAVFTISAVYAAVGGVLYAIVSGFIFTDLASLELTLEFVVAVIVGGMGSVVGPVVAMGVIEWLPHLVEPIEEHVGLVLGLLLTVLVPLLPPPGKTRTFPSVLSSMGRRRAVRQDAVQDGPSVNLERQA